MARSPSPIETPTQRREAARGALAALEEAIERELGQESTRRPPLAPVLAILRQHVDAPPAATPPELRAALDLLEDLLAGLMEARSR